MSRNANEIYIFPLVFAHCLAVIFVNVARIRISVAKYRLALGIFCFLFASIF